MNVHLKIRPPAYAELWPEIQKPSCEPMDRVVIMYMSLAISHPALKLVSLNFHDRIYLSLFSLNFRLISWTSAVSQGTGCLRQFWVEKQLLLYHSGESLFAMVLVKIILF